MKYIGNAFSPAMFKEEDRDMMVNIKTITKHQYLKVRDHAKSVIGHPELAEYFELPLNRETVHLRKGDQLYVALPKKRYREGESVRYGEPLVEFRPEEYEFVYKLIQVL